MRPMSPAFRILNLGYQSELLKNDRIGQDQALVVHLIRKDGSSGQWNCWFLPVPSDWNL